MNTFDYFNQWPLWHRIKEMHPDLPCQVFRYILQSLLNLMLKRQDKNSSLFLRFCRYQEDSFFFIFKIFIHRLNNKVDTAGYQLNVGNPTDPAHDCFFSEAVIAHLLISLSILSKILDSAYAPICISQL